MTRQPKPVPDARPFLKWAGGKTQLLQEFSRHLPEGLRTGAITRYVEPFVGGGAMFFYLNQRYAFDTTVICDANEELVLTYRVIRRSVEDLIDGLEHIEADYMQKDAPGREAFYYAVRDAFNRKKAGTDFRRFRKDWVGRAAQVIFLNRTCYNGLFRMNRAGTFNVPFGRYACPDILNKDNLADVATLLANTQIVHGDFSKCRRFIKRDTFVYLDPPYRPLSKTSSFTCYAKGGFPDREQVRLAGFCRDIDRAGAQFMLSNSDPKNENGADSFFDDLYRGFRIARVPARRMINCNGSRRGAIRELLVANYGPEPC